MSNTVQSSLNAVINNTIPCGICLSPLAGNVVAHGPRTPVLHAIHHECFLDWQRRAPFQRKLCIFRCDGEVEYINRPIEFHQITEQVHRCVICNLESREAHPQRGEVFYHTGQWGDAHGVHRECMKQVYGRVKTLRCPLNCRASFSINNIFTLEERRQLLFQQKITTCALSVLFTAVALMTLCFIFYKIQQLAIPLIKSSHISFQTYLATVPKSMHLYKKIAFGFLQFLSAGGAYAAPVFPLYLLVEKVSSHFRQFKAEIVNSGFVAGALALMEGYFIFSFIGYSLSPLNGVILAAIGGVSLVTGMVSCFDMRENDLVMD